MRPYLAELARIADCYVSCYPNAGLPNAFGAVRRAAGRHRRLPAASSPTSGFVNIVGGCCGTTPDHIAAIAEAVDGLPPRRRHSTPMRQDPSVTVRAHSRSSPASSR